MTTSAGAANRRDFLKAAAATALAAPLAGQTVHSVDPTTVAVDLMRAPDLLTARFANKDLVSLAYAAQAWTCRRVSVVTEAVQKGARRGLSVRLRNGGDDLTHIHLRWEGRTSDSLLSLCDAWERSYGDLEWRCTAPERVMPWYFMTFDGERVDGYGVETQPSAFCFWQRDTDGITLTIDVRNGGGVTDLGDRELTACTVVQRAGIGGESVADAGRVFCSVMCPHPRLQQGALFGINDWNYAYGKNTASGILRDADLIASLAPAGNTRPLVVIDDGWQDPVRFPSMPGLAAQIRERHLRPGLWIRPLRAATTAPEDWLLPDARFGNAASHNNLAYDPTHPEALAAAMESVHTAVAWSYDFIKHDFSTWELLGRWGFEMRAEITSPGWHFHDRTRTTAEIIRDFYRAIRAAAGESITILGCNTVGHLAAGIFESQRIADDTSGHDWERTRRYGVNGLAQRIAQHRTFYHVDPDCVAITANVAWTHTRDWMDVVARSGTSLFLSPDPGSVTPEIKSSMRDAMLLAVQNGSGAPTHPIASRTPVAWQFYAPGFTTKTYDWTGPAGVTPFDV